MNRRRRGGRGEGEDDEKRLQKMAANSCLLAGSNER